MFPALPEYLYHKVSISVDHFRLVRELRCRRHHPKDFDKTLYLMENPEFCVSNR